MSDEQKPRMFPIQSQRGAKPHPLSIPWYVAELAYSVYAGLYGRGQSLQRLAERGGFGPNEMDEFLPDWRERCDTIKQLTEDLHGLKDIAEQRQRLKQEVALHRSKAKDEYWCWQGDGGDHLESLVCPVLIPAANLRAILDERDELVASIMSEDEQALMDAERSSCHEAASVLLTALGWASGGLASAAREIVAERDRLRAALRKSAQDCEACGGTGLEVEYGYDGLVMPDGYIRLCAEPRCVLVRAALEGRDR